MNGVRLEWNVWSGAAAALVAAALVALGAVLSGPYSNTDSKILYTLGAALLGMSTLVAGRALVTRGGFLLGWTAVVLAPLAFALLVYAIWEGATDRSEAETQFWLGAMTLVAALLAVTARLLAQARVTVRIAYAAGIFGALAATLSFDAAATHEQFWKVGTAITLLWGAAALLYFLVPVLERSISQSDRWMAAAGVLVGGALAGFVALLDGEFSPQGYSLFFTLIAAVVALSAMLGGVVAIEREARAVGWTSVALSPIAFAMIADGIWQDTDDRYELLLTGIVVLIGLLIAVAARLFARSRTARLFANASGATSAIATAIAIRTIWSDDRVVPAERTAIAAWIVAVLCCLLVPVVERYLQAAPPEASA